jgi:hypothetical protein
MAFSGEWDPLLVGSILADIHRRGPDMLGIAALIEGNWHIERQRVSSWPGRVSLAVPHGAAAGIVHNRLVTSGGALQDAQPIELPGMVFAHNGIIERHRGLAVKYGLKLRTENDSEALGALFQAARYHPENTWGALHSHQHDTPHAWIAASTTRMWVASWGQPLFFYQDHSSAYVSSWSFSGSERIPAGESRSWLLWSEPGSRGIPIPHRTSRDPNCTAKAG